MLDGMYSQNQQRVMSRSQQHSNNSDTYSSQSVLTAVQQFVSTINTMNETIMVPSRLLDMELSNNENRPVPELLRTDKDAFAVYGILNTTKNDLLYGLAIADEDDDDDDVVINSRMRRNTYSDRWSSPCDSIDVTLASKNSNAAVKQPQTPVRRESTLSMISVNSSNSDTSIENDIVEESHDNSSDGTDSALGAEDAATSSSASTTMIANTPPATSVVEASSQLKGHLIGLYSCLTQLSDTASYLTDRYQEDILE